MLNERLPGTRVESVSSALVYKETALVYQQAVDPNRANLTYQIAFYYRYKVLSSGLPESLTGVKEGTPEYARIRQVQDDYVEKINAELRGLGLKEDELLTWKMFVQDKDAAATLAAKTCLNTFYGKSM